MLMMENLHLLWVSISVSMLQIHLYFYIEPYVQFCKKNQTLMIIGKLFKISLPICSVTKFFYNFIVL